MAKWHGTVGMVAIKVIGLYIMLFCCYSDDSGPQKFSVEVVGDDTSLPSSHTWYDHEPLCICVHVNFHFLFAALTSWIFHHISLMND